MGFKERLQGIRDFFHPKYERDPTQSKNHAINDLIQQAMQNPIDALPIFGSSFYVDDVSATIADVYKIINPEIYNVYRLSQENEEIQIADRGRTEKPVTSPFMFDSTTGYLP